MVNQISYLPDGSKYATIRTDLDLSGFEYRIIDLDTGEEYIYRISTDLGQGYSFSHHYFLNFSDLGEGKYAIKIGDVSSYIFYVGKECYVNVASDASLFFDLNRCGPSSFHNICHIDDGVIYNGPLRGTHINMTGGWHDAADYIKFTSTIAESIILMEEALLRGKLDTSIISSASKNILWGIDYLGRVWISDNKMLVYMVGNRTDHFQGFRLPEDDQLKNRPVYVCDSGKGANIAGLVSSALSLAYILSSCSLINYSEKEELLNISIDVYEYGLNNRKIQEIGIGDWIAYPDYGWEDDMAFASILLYNITGKNKYLDNAIEFFEQYVNSSDVIMTTSNIFAFIYLYESGYDYSVDIYYELLWNMENSNNDPLFFIYDTYYWGNIEAMCRVVICEILYEKATKDHNFSTLKDRILN